MKCGRVRDHRNDAGTLPPLKPAPGIACFYLKMNYSSILLSLSTLVLAFAILSFLLCVFTYCKLGAYWWSGHVSLAEPS